MKRRRLKEFIRHLVMQYSRGNVHLQLGRYVTQKEFDLMKKRVSRMKFV